MHITIGPDFVQHSHNVLACIAQTMAEHESSTACMCCRDSGFLRIKAPSHGSKGQLCHEGLGARPKAQALHCCCCRRQLSAASAQRRRISWRAAWPWPACTRLQAADMPTPLPRCGCGCAPLHVWAVRKAPWPGASACCPRPAICMAL